MEMAATEDHPTENPDFRRQQHVSPGILHAAAKLNPGQKKQEKKERRIRRRKMKTVAGVAMESKKRQLTEEQARALELSFTRDRRLDTARKDRLAAELGLDPRQVAVWFQNRRARWRCKQIEKDHASVCASYDTLVVEKHRLESQVMELQAQLDEAKNEIARLLSGPLGSTAEANCSSPNCSTLTFISGDTMNQHNDPPSLAESKEILAYLCASSMDDILWDWPY